MLDWSVDPKLKNSAILLIIIMGIVGLFASLNLIFKVYPNPPNSLDEFFTNPIIAWILIGLASWASVLAIRSSRDFLEKHIPWKKRIDEKITNIETGLRPDVYYSASYLKKIKETNESTVINNKITSISWGLLVIGTSLLLVGIFLYTDSTINDRDAYQYWKGINFFKTKSLTHTLVDLNFILKDDESLIHIYYFTKNIHNGSFIGIQIPYEGKLTENNNGWISETMPSKTTFIYKKFECGMENSVCNYINTSSDTSNDQYNLLFKIDKLIDAKRFYTHSLDIPVGGSTVDKLMEKIQFEISDEGVWSWQENWENVTGKLSVSVQDDATEINVIPPARPQRISFESSEMGRTAYSWNIPNTEGVFHIDYVMPNERDYYEKFNTFGIVFISNGISLLGVFIGTTSWHKIKNSINLKNQ